MARGVCSAQGQLADDALCIPKPARCSAGTLQLRGRARTALGVAAGGLFIALLTGGLVNNFGSEIKGFIDKLRT